MLRIRRETLAWHVVGDELVVLDLQNSFYFSLNSSARILWDRLLEGSEYQGLVEALREVYDLDESQARSDTNAFIEELKRHDLLDGDA